MTQLLPGLQGYLPFNRGLHLIPPDIEEHHCDAEASNRIIEAEIDHTYVVKYTLPIVLGGIFICYWRDTTQNESYYVYENDEQNENSNDFLMSLK